MADSVDRPDDAVELLERSISRLCCSPNPHTGRARAPADREVRAFWASLRRLGDRHPSVDAAHCRLVLRLALAATQDLFNGDFANALATLGTAESLTFAGERLPHALPLRVLTYNALGAYHRRLGEEKLALRFLLAAAELGKRQSSGGAAGKQRGGASRWGEPQAAAGGARYVHELARTHLQLYAIFMRSERYARAHKHARAAAAHATAPLSLALVGALEGVAASDHAGRGRGGERAARSAVKAAAGLTLAVAYRCVGVSARASSAETSADAFRYLASAVEVAAAQQAALQAGGAAPGAEAAATAVVDALEMEHAQAKHLLPGWLAQQQADDAAAAAPEHQALSGLAGSVARGGASRQGAAAGTPWGAGATGLWESPHVDGSRGDIATGQQHSELHAPLGEMIMLAPLMGRGSHRPGSSLPPPSTLPSDRELQRQGFFGSASARPQQQHPAQHEVEWSTTTVGQVSLGAGLVPLVQRDGGSTAATFQMRSDDSPQHSQHAQLDAEIPAHSSSPPAPLTGGRSAQVRSTAMVRVSRVLASLLRWHLARAWRKWITIIAVDRAAHDARAATERERAAQAAVAQSEQLARAAQQQLQQAAMQQFSRTLAHWGQRKLGAAWDTWAAPLAQARAHAAAAERERALQEMQAQLDSAGARLQAQSMASEEAQAAAAQNEQLVRAAQQQLQQAAMQQFSRTLAHWGQRKLGAAWDTWAAPLAQARAHAAAAERERAMQALPSQRDGTIAGRVQDVPCTPSAAANNAMVVHALSLTDSAIVAQSLIRGFVSRRYVDTGTISPAAPCPSAPCPD